MIKELAKFKDEPKDIKVTEIRVKLSNGSVVAGKWWGDLNKKPVIMLHGWQDNSGSYDRLIPLLPRNISYLAIDFIGHGKSSWLPESVNYHVLDNLFTLLDLMKEYKWDKIAMIGHSMGSMVGFQFSILFPEKVNFLVIIDGFKNLDRTFDEELNDTRENTLNLMTVHERIKSKMEPPCYKLEEMIQKVNSSSFFNITTKSAPYLLERSITRSQKYPDKFYFSRDPRLRHIMLMSHPEKSAIECAKRIINLPLLFFTTKEMSPLYAKMEYFNKIVNVLKNNPKFQLEAVDSDSHYFHLNDPEMISNVLGMFLLENEELMHHL